MNNVVLVVLVEHQEFMNDFTWNNMGEINIIACLVDQEVNPAVSKLHQDGKLTLSSVVHIEAAGFCYL